MKTMLMTSKQEITHVLTHFRYTGEGLNRAFLFQRCFHPILQCLEQAGLVFLPLNINKLN